MADLTGGALGSAATYLPGRRVPGVRIDDDFLAVHLVVTLERPLQEVAADVRRELAGAFSGHRIDVVVEDVVAEDAEPEDAEPEDAEPEDAEPQNAEPQNAEPQVAKPAGRARRPGAKSAMRTATPEGLP